MDENDEVAIRLPIAVGRVHDDALSPVERAFCAALSEIPTDRLRAIVDEVLSWKAFRLELEELLLLLGDEG